jgi:hypothetical protein
MALAVTIQLDFKDAKNKSSSTKVRVPTGNTIAQYVEFAQDFAQLAANISTARIIGVSVNFALDISGGLSNVISNLSNVASKAFLQFRSSVSGFFAKMKIPTFDEDNLVIVGTEDIDTTVLAVDDLITAITGGLAVTGGTIAPCDKYGNDLTDLSFARGIFAKHAG